MELDWTTLYDYMSIFSQTEIKKKINKFYQSFYPLKFKKSGQKKLELRKVERTGLLGIVASYIQEVLFTLEIFLEAEYFLATGELKDDLKLSRMFVEIQKKNLQLALELEKTVYVITELSKIFNETGEDRAQDKQYFEIKMICSLNRLFEFFYTLHAMRNRIAPQGYELIDNALRLFAFKVCEKAKHHIRLFPQLGEILKQILIFFSGDVKEPFNFYSHLSDSSEHQPKKTYPERVKKLVAMIPNRQKAILVNLNDENLYEYLSKSGVAVPREPIENYFRCEEEINSIIAEEENFIESILISEKYRGMKTWREKVFEQLVNLSIEKKEKKEDGNPKIPSSRILNSKQFRLSDDFPIQLN